jgi:two-component system, NarL family, invasion response regulator UvrY
LFAGIDHWSYVHREPMPSVLIIDDNFLAREGLKHLLGQELRGLVFGEATTSEEAATRLAKRSWDVAVIEVSMPGQDGFHMLQEIRRSCPATRVLMMSTRTDPEYFLRARQLKALGYAAKNTSRNELLTAFHSVLLGKEHFVTDSEDADRFWNPAHPPLSTRERDVLQACVAGKRVSEIAGELNLSIKTVSTYKRRILNKLRINSVAELVRHAIDHKLC